MNKYLKPEKYFNYFASRVRRVILYANNWIKSELIKRGYLKSGKIIQEKILKYCKSLQGNKPWLYRYSAKCPETLWASAFAALVLYLIGELGNLSDNDRNSWIKYIQQFQDKKTGFFLDPKFKPEDQKSAIHTKEHLFAHSSTFVMGALVLLGGKPLHPIRWIHEFRDPKKMEIWLEMRPWVVSPWLVGNWSYDMGCAIGMDYLITKDKKDLIAMNAYFNWFDKHQLEKTGWWDLSGKASIYEQIYGGYHALMVYRMFDRPIPMAEKMIKTALSIQSEKGVFTKNKEGGSCQDMDAIDTLVGLSVATNYKQQEVKKSLLRALPVILSKQNYDGGFYDNLNTGRAEFKWKFCSAGPGESDICSTLFYGFCVALIGEFLGDKKIADTKWHHHQTYCHCVNKKNQIKQFNFQ